MDHPIFCRSSYQFLTADDFKEGDWTPIIIKSCFKDLVNLSIDAGEQVYIHFALHLLRIL